MPEERPKKLRRLSPKPDKGKTIRILYVEDAAVIRDTISRTQSRSVFDAHPS